MKKKINIEDLSEEELIELFGKFLMSPHPGGLGALSNIERMQDEEDAELEKKTKTSRD